MNLESKSVNELSTNKLTCEKVLKKLYGPDTKVQVDDVILSDISSSEEENYVDKLIKKLTKKRSKKLKLRNIQTILKRLLSTSENCSCLL